MTRRRVPPGLRAIVLVPDASDPRLTVAERIALTVRNGATGTGRCACGAVGEVPAGKIVAGETNYGVMRHEPDCPAVSKAAYRAIRKLGGAA